jgi:CRISPR/Cas system-associated exonuclease Cas4 (RecB family)
MPKVLPWSYSSLTLFDQCPKKYYHLKVAKDVKEPESEAIIYGKEVHLAAEEFVRDGKPIPEKFAYITPMLEKLAKIEGEKYCEYQMGVKKTGAGYHMTNFFDKEAWYRGIADLLIVDKKNAEARLVDYKTGKSSEYADMKQLKLLAAATFVHFPDVKKIKAGLLFVVAKDFITEEYEFTQRDAYFEPFIPIVQQLEGAVESDTWNPKRNFSCKNWCPVLECSHNGRR